MARIKVQLGEPSFHFISKDLDSKAKSRPENVFDFTMLSSYMECPTKYYYRHEENLASIESAPAALLMGAGIHAALALYYKFIRRTSDLDILLDGMRKAFLSEVADAVREGSFPVEVVDAHDGKRCVRRAFDIIDGYIDHYQFDDQIDEIKEVEQPFAMILPYYDEVSKDSGDVIYVGRRDAVVEIGGNEYVLEHKTSSRISQFYLESYTLNHQVSGYIKSVRELTGSNTSRAIINILGVYKTGTRYERTIVSRTNAQLDSFVKQVTNMTAQILDNRRRIKDGDFGEHVFWQNPGSCFKWNSRCQYHAVCVQSGMGAKETLKESRFRKDVWSPYDIATEKDEDKDKDRGEKNGEVVRHNEEDTAKEETQ